MKRIYVIAGGNGAGKTTFFNTYLQKEGMIFLNADILANNLNPDKPEAASYEAAELIRHMIVDLIQKDISFCYETVFSHPSKIDYLAMAKQHGYEVNLVYLHLASSDLNEARVHQRISIGGHSVPIEKIHSRIPRMIKHISEAVQIADEVLLVDNSSAYKPFVTVAKISRGRIEYLIKPVPKWVTEIIRAWL